MKTIIPVLCCISTIGVPGSVSSSEPTAYRFEAEIRHADAAPSPDSLTARVASFRKITGSFGYAPDAELTSGAGIPGRIAFAVYSTGFILVNEANFDTPPGAAIMRVADGITQSGDPKMIIDDDLNISVDRRALDGSVETMSLTLRYKDAEVLAGTAIPASLDQNNFASIHLVFSNRIDSFGNRNNQVSGTANVIGLVNFEVTRIERVQ